MCNNFEKKASKSVHFNLKAFKYCLFKAFYRLFQFKKVKKSRKGHQHTQFCGIREALSYDV